MNHPSQFLDHIIEQFLLRMHDWPADNYDAARFAVDGIDHSREYDARQHKDYLHFLYRNHESLFNAYCVLEDEQSKAIFIDLILFKLAGRLHVKLAANNPNHWAQRIQASRLPAKPSVLAHTGLFGPLEHFDQVEFARQRLRVDSWRMHMAWTFFIRQYYFERDGVTVGPRSGDHAIDVGGCMGETALAFAATVGPTGRVYTFDPLEKHLEIIRHNVAQNPTLAETIRVFGLGLGDSSRPNAPPLESNGVAPGFSLAQVADQECIPVETLDNLVAGGEIERVDFLKMDVEGYELKALRGAEGTIRRFRPRLAICVYHHPQDMYEIPAFIHDLGLGYKLYLDHYTIHAEETVLYAVV